MQAIGAGVDSRNHSYHVKAGNWTRVARGVYRLSILESDPREPYFAALLWTRNRDERIDGALSHDNALFIHGLTKVPPENITVSVPKTFRRNSGPPAGVQLGYTELPDNAVEEVRGLQTTTIQRTFSDLIVERKRPTEEIKRLMIMAIRLDKTTSASLKKIEVPDELKRVLGAILFEIED